MLLENKMHQAVRHTIAVFWVLIILGMGGGAQFARAQNTPYGMECIRVTELDSRNMVPQLARSVRDCVYQGRYPDAIQVFFAYSIFIDFDRKRVKQDRQNDAIADLHNWIFADFPRPAIHELRFYANALRDQDGWFFQQTCAAVQAAGPPTYLPYYLVGRGIAAETATSGWEEAGFDIETNWLQSLAANGCPTG